MCLIVNHMCTILYKVWQTNAGQSKLVGNIKKELEVGFLVYIERFGYAHLSQSARREYTQYVKRSLRDR